LKAGDATPGLSGAPPVTLGAQVPALNRGQAWRHRDDWNRVLPVLDANLTVDRPGRACSTASPAPTSRC